MIGAHGLNYPQPADGAAWGILGRSLPGLIPMVEQGATDREPAGFPQFL
jgi:hypothetical protein